MWIVEGTGSCPRDELAMSEQVVNCAPQAGVPSRKVIVDPAQFQAENAERDHSHPCAQQRPFDGRWRGLLAQSLTEVSRQLAAIQC